MQADRITCVTCRHEIDASAKVCAYCGCEPRTGEKLVDAQAMIREVFNTDGARGRGGILDLFRQRQGAVLIGAAVVLALILGGIWSFVSRRNETDVSAASAVPLAEVTDLTTQNEDARPQPMPDLPFQYDGHPQTMRTYVMEPGAVAPNQPPAVPAAGAPAVAAPPPAPAAH
jgi:hypothetical protein